LFDVLDVLDVLTGVDGDTRLGDLGLLDLLLELGYMYFLFGPLDFLLDLLLDDLELPLDILN